MEEKWGYSEAGVLKKWKAEWRHDRLHGEYTEFYPNGQKRSATNTRTAF